MIFDPPRTASAQAARLLPATRPGPLDDASPSDPRGVRPHAADPGMPRDVLHGLMAGVAGTWTLDRIDWFFYDREPEWSRRRTRQVRPGGEDPAHALATRLERLAGVRPSRSTHEAVGLLIHYLAGTLPAGLYGALRPHTPGGALQGLAYGLVGFLGDLYGSPASGLAAPARAYPKRVHARSLVAHLAYGLVTELVIQALERREPTCPTGADQRRRPDSSRSR